jgi:hypothetical protein
MKLLRDGNGVNPTPGRAAARASRVFRILATFRSIHPMSASAVAPATIDRRLRVYESRTLSSPSTIRGWANPSPIRIPARENDLENVRRTITFCRSRASSRAVSSAKSAYASSTTSRPGTASASSASARTGTAVPEGEFGFATIVTRAFFRASPRGRE